MVISLDLSVSPLLLPGDSFSTNICIHIARSWTSFHIRLRVLTSPAFLGWRYWD